MALLTNKLAYKGLQTYCEMDAIKQTLAEQPGQSSSAQKQPLYRSRYPWASSIPTERGFSHLLFPLLVSKWPTILDTELAPPWQCLLCQDGHHTAFTSTELWQSIPSLSPRNLILAQSPCFLLPFLSILTACGDLFQLEMKTLWCCICKFLKKNKAYLQSCSPWAFQQSNDPTIDNRHCLRDPEKSLKSFVSLPLIILQCSYLKM